MQTDRKREGSASLSVPACLTASEVAALRIICCACVAFCDSGYSISGYLAVFTNRILLRSVRV